MLWSGRHFLERKIFVLHWNVFQERVELSSDEIAGNGHFRKFDDTDDKDVQEDENAQNNYNVVYYIINEPTQVEADEVRNMPEIETMCNNSYPNESNERSAMEIRRGEILEENFNWSGATTLLLINEYMDRLTRFRDPKIKKKTLWNEIKEVFFEKGYFVSCSALDRKWRNLKKTYTTIKDNTRRTGRGRMTWEYFEYFEEIYCQDSTMNMPNTIASLPTEATDIHEYNTCSSENTLCTSLSKSSPSVPNIGNNILSLPQQSTVPNRSNTLSVSLPKPSPTLSTRSNISCVSSPSSSQSTLLTHPYVRKNNSNKEKSIRNRALYSFRKKQLEIEELRVNEIKLLRAAVENNNIIQEQRNEILRKYVEQRGSTHNLINE